jgi:probable HAF family extracellular repeat protein
MKSNKLTCITALALLVALAIPVWLAAQEHPAKHYRLIDLGTFGGRISEISIGSFSINSHGLAVGGAETSVSQPPHSNPWSCGPGTDVYHGFEWHKGVKRDLGSLAPVDDDCSNAGGINASGEISGASENGAIDPLTGITEVRAVIWKDGHIKNLGTLGGNHSSAQWINDQGQVVGFALNKIADPYSWFDFDILNSANGTQTRAFIWQDGKKMQDLGTLGGPDAVALSVNEPGQVDGFSYINGTPNSNNGPACPPNVPTQDPFFWEQRKMTDLGTLGGTCGFPNGMNNLGQVIGQSDLKGDVFYHPFFWEKGKRMQDLHTLGGNDGSATWINDAGEVVGWANTKSGFQHAVLWKKNGRAYKAHDLGVLTGDVNSYAFMINAKSQIVGCSWTSPAFCNHATLWENGAIFDLNKLIPPRSPLSLAIAIFVNDSGEIGGVGFPPGCQNTDTCGHAFLLIPKKTQ